MKFYSYMDYLPRKTSNSFLKNGITPEICSPYLLVNQVSVSLFSTVGLI